jgi:SAM-dependent methyltransferase
MKTEQDTYSLFAKFYDAYVGDYTQDLPLYLGLASKVKSPILEIGCGSGRVLLPLLRAGHKVTGVDISGEMLQLAIDKLDKNQLQEKSTLLNYNFVNQALPQTFGLALVTFYTFNYLLSPEHQRAFLDHVAESLLPGSSIALHLFFPHPLLHPETAGTWITKGRYSIDDQKFILHDRRDMAEKQVEERTQVFEYESGIREEIRTLRRLVTKDEIYHLLLSSGFSAPVLINNFNLEEQTQMHPGLKTASEFFVKAEKK